MDAKSFITNDELYLFAQGTLYKAWDSFGAHIKKGGVKFTLWCPWVKSVSVCGSFNDWNPDEYWMEPSEVGGVWHAFVKGVKEGDSYKYVIELENGERIYKADPYAFSAEVPPETASVVARINKYKWDDAIWMEKRSKNHFSKQPLNIYEVHLGSWKRKGENEYLTYKELAKELPRYVKKMGYTHVELLPVMEFPFDGSWGYQTTGYYAASSRFGKPEDFQLLVDEFHKAGIGVILDWVPGHFCRDAHGLGRFNGHKLYEIRDHKEWGTYEFDFGRGEVKSFLISNAMFWIEQFHADGLRVDGVSSIIYMNYGVHDESRKRYNDDGSEGDLIALEFLRDLNTAIGKKHKDVMLIAEESTAWPLVTYPPRDGGLGFHYKWDMGWMHDTLNYLKTDFMWRPGNHNMLTFSMMYAFNENFILPLSHDEVVHGKCSLIVRSPGDYWRQFANLRLLALYQICHPGGKLNFMGNEIAQFIEWRYYEQIEWDLVEKFESHRKHQGYIVELNKLYKKTKALWIEDKSWDGFQWLDANDSEQSILLFERKGVKKDDFLTCVLNFQPDVYHEFRVGVPEGGTYYEIFNSDDEAYGGSGQINQKLLKADKIPAHNQPYSISLTVPPIAGCLIAKKKTAKAKMVNNNATKQHEKSFTKKTSVAKTAKKIFKEEKKSSKNSAKNLLVSSSKIKEKKKKIVESNKKTADKVSKKPIDKKKTLNKPRIQKVSSRVNK